jgi:hypothetical protein
MYNGIIKTLEDACKYTGVDITALSNESDSPDERAYKELKVIIKARNKESNGGVEWKADWKDRDKDKYVPWFHDPGSGFSLCFIDYWRTATSVPDCLCFVNEKTASDTVNDFKEIYRRYLS